MKKNQSIPVEEIKLAIADLRQVDEGKEFLKALSPAVRPFSRLDLVYRDRASLVLNAMVQADWLGTIQQETGRR